MSTAVDTDGEDTLPVRGHALPVAKYSDGGWWRDMARCRDEDKQSFFIEGGRGTSPRQLAAQRELALCVCAECPVRLNCLNYALRNEERFGVWGGVDFSRLSGNERSALWVRIERANLT